MPTLLMMLDPYQYLIWLLLASRNGLSIRVLDRFVSITSATERVQTAHDAFAHAEYYILMHCCYSLDSCMD